MAERMHVDESGMELKIPPHVWAQFPLTGSINVVLEGESLPPSHPAFVTGAQVDELSSQRLCIAKREDISGHSNMDCI